MMTVNLSLHSSFQLIALFVPRTGRLFVYHLHEAINSKFSVLPTT